VPTISEYARIERRPERQGCRSALVMVGMLSLWIQEHADHLSNLRPQDVRISLPPAEARRNENIMSIELAGNATGAPLQILATISSSDRRTIADWLSRKETIVLIVHAADDEKASLTYHFELAHA